MANRDTDNNDGNRVAEVKVSSDGGETWHRRKINFGVDLEESGLSVGEMFQFQEDKYQVVNGENGMTAQKINPPKRRKR